MKLVVILLLFLCIGASALQADWTQYSESASLPMSKKYRDQLRERLQGIDESILPPDQQAKIAKLKLLLNEEPIEEPQQMSPSPLFFMLVSAGAIAYFVYLRFKNTLILTPSPDELRKSRISKYD